MRHCFLAVSLTWVIALASAPAQKAPSSSIRQTSPLTVKQLWTLDGKYTDPQHGVTFRYPSTWNAAVEFGYWAPSLTTYNNPEPIAGFGYHTGGFPRMDNSGPYARTTLEGFGIVYTAFTVADATACESRAAIVAGSHVLLHTRFGGRLFSARETGTGGMSQSSSGTLYATYAHAICYLFEINETAIAEQIADDIVAEQQAGDNAHSIFLKGVSKGQAKEITSGFQKIMESVRIR